MAAHGLCPLLRSPPGPWEAVREQSSYLREELVRVGLPWTPQHPLPRSTCFPACWRLYLILPGLLRPLFPACWHLCLFLQLVWDRKRGVPFTSSRGPEILMVFPAFTACRLRQRWMRVPPTRDTTTPLLGGSKELSEHLVTLPTRSRKGFSLGVCTV